jgi:purine-cytosine permease-like protein
MDFMPKHSDNTVVEDGFEVIGVNPIPKNERNMSPWKFFIFWAMASGAALVPIAGKELYNMGLIYAIIAIVIALLIGLIPAGLISDMGRQIPVPSLVVARKTYGYMTSGAYSLIFTFLNLGYFGLNDSVGAVILSSLTHSPILYWYIIMGAIQILLVLLGAKWLEYFFRYTAPLLVISFGILTYFLFTTYTINVSNLLNPIGKYTWGGALDFLLGFSILAWTYKISTQSRFGRPFSGKENKKTRAGYFVASPLGIMLPVLLMGIVGFFGNSLNPGSGWNIAVLSFPGVSGIDRIIIIIAAILLALSLIHPNAMNLYPATADLLTSIQPLFGKSVHEKWAQPVATLLLGIGGIILAIEGILARISGFIDILEAIIFPFTFILIFDWFKNLRHTTRIGDYYKIPRNIKNNIKFGALIPAFIGTVIAIFGIGPYDYIFAYFPKALFGSFIGLLLYIVIYYIRPERVQLSEKQNDYDRFNMEAEDSQ